MQLGALSMRWQLANLPQYLSYLISANPMLLRIKTFSESKISQCSQQCKKHLHLWCTIFAKLLKHRQQQIFWLGRTLQWLNHRNWAWATLQKMSVAAIFWPLSTLVYAPILSGLKMYPVQADAYGNPDIDYITNTSKVIGNFSVSQSPDFSSLLQVGCVSFWQNTRLCFFCFALAQWWILSLSEIFVPDSSFASFAETD